MTSRTWRHWSFRNSDGRFARVWLASCLRVTGWRRCSRSRSIRDVDLVVSDINMPRMDGLSLLAKLQESEDKKSTIIVSAYGDMSNIRTAMNRGAFDFLTKPIDFADLEATIDKTLRHIEMLREARRRQAEAERAHASLSRYFSPELAKRLAAERGRQHGGDLARRCGHLHRHNRLHLARGDCRSRNPWGHCSTSMWPE